MPSILKSRKGMETAPLFIMFSAFVILLLASFMFTEMQKWGRINDFAKTTREATKVAQTIDEIKTLGDSGSVEEIHVDVPAGCCVRLEAEGVISWCVFSNDDTKYRDVIETKTGIGNIKNSLDNDEICGKSVDVVVAHWNGKDIAPKGSYIIYVSGN